MMVTWVMFLAIGILIGVALGIFMSRMDDATKRKQNALTQELDASHRQLAEYKSEVNAHFVTTAKLVNHMTESYRAVHEHLSQGAVDLCDNSAEIEAIPFNDAKTLVAGPDVSEERPVTEGSTNVSLDPGSDEVVQSEVVTQDLQENEEVSVEQVAGPTAVESNPPQEVAKQNVTPIVDLNVDSNVDSNTAIDTEHDPLQDLKAEQVSVDVTTDATANATTEIIKSAEVGTVDMTESGLSELEQSRINASRMVH
jgi:hypothetical protein